MPGRTWIEEKEEAVIKKSHALSNAGKQIGIASAFALPIFLNKKSKIIDRKQITCRNSDGECEHYTVGDFSEMGQQHYKEKLKKALHLAFKVAFLVSLPAAVASFTDYKLAPEPDAGIKVIINVAQ